MSKVLDLGLVRGPKGDPVELEVVGYVLQWRYVGETEWRDLIDLSTLPGGGDGSGGSGEPGTKWWAADAGTSTSSGRIQFLYVNMTGTGTASRTSVRIGDFVLYQGTVHVVTTVSTAACAAMPTELSLVGPQGEKGEKGDPGTAGVSGVDGAEWWVLSRIDSVTGLGNIKGLFSEMSGRVTASISTVAKGDFLLCEGKVYVVDALYSSYCLAAPTGLNISGRGIKEVVLVSGNHAPGTTDVYRIIFTDDGYFEFSVYNGANGTGGSGGSGENGATFTPSVSADGVISWSNDKGLTNPTPVSIKGPQGEKGEKGNAGAQGDAGPNEVSTATASSITGIIKGSGGKLAAAVAGTDYLPPSAKGAANGLASLDSNTKLSPAQASARVVSVAANKTLALTDAGCLLQVNSSSARTLTIPTNSSVAFPLGAEIEILRYGSGDVTIAASSGVTIRCSETARTIAKQYTGVSLKKLATNEWLLMGNLG